MEETTMADVSDTDLLRLTVKIVSAHIGKNHVAANELPDVIQSVYRSLAAAGMAEPAPVLLTPAVPVRQSVFPDYIICLEDGQKLKMLKRHLQASYGMSPEQYRQKWNLPANYPMVARNYAMVRSSLAKQIGLDQKPGSPDQTATTVGEAPGLPAEPPVTQGRARRARGSRG